MSDETKSPGEGPESPDDLPASGPRSGGPIGGLCLVDRLGDWNDGGWRQRRILYWVVLLLLPILALAVLEGLLRVTGIGAPPPLFRHVSAEGIDGYITNAEVGRRYFPPAMQANMPQLGFQYFPKEKSEKTFRFFSLGGSSTAGFPYHSHASFTGLLAARLEHLVPSRQFESVNCAMTAINSNAGVDFISEILDHDPDLVLIYMGHNEFYGAGGVGTGNTLGRLPASPFVRFLLDLRLSNILRRTLRIGYGRNTGEPGRNVMETMAAEREIPYGSALREDAARMFRRNLTDIVRRCRRQDVPVMLCEISSNLRDQAPFGSAHAERFAQEAACDDFVREAARGQQEGNLMGAFTAISRAVDLDSTYAAARYRKAQILDALGQAPAARAEYVAAREMDAVPFRAPAAIGRVIREVAAAERVPLVAVDSILALGSPGAIVGSQFFLEHLHFNLHGNSWVARAIATRMYDENLVAPHGQWRWAQELRPVEYAQRAGVTELDLEIGDQRVHMLKQKWPYLRAGETPAPYNSTRDPKIVELASAFIAKDIELNEAHNTLGAYYKEQGEFWRALSEYLSSFRMFPLDPNPAVEAGELWLRLGDPGEAGMILVRALELQPDSERSLLLLAHALYATGSTERASALLERVLRTNPQSPGALALRDTIAVRTTRR